MTAIDYFGKTVIVTGAAGGLGQALCRRFAAAGANIALLDLDGNAAKSLGYMLQASKNIRAIGIACDVTDDAACCTAMQSVIAAFGGIDLLINNAGIAHRSLLRDTALPPPLLADAAGQGVVVDQPRRARHLRASDETSCRFKEITGNEPEKNGHEILHASTVGADCLERGGNGNPGGDRCGYRPVRQVACNGNGDAEGGATGRAGHLR